jgi:hypothetical protein
LERRQPLREIAEALLGVLGLTGAGGAQDICEAVAELLRGSWVDSAGADAL